MYHSGLRGSEHGRGGGRGGVSDTGRLSILTIPGAELHLNHELMVSCHED